MNFKITDNKILSLLLYFLLIFIISFLDNYLIPRFKVRFTNGAIKFIPIVYLVYFYFFVYLIPKKFFNWKWSNLKLKYNDLKVPLVLVLLFPLSFLIAEPKALVDLTSKFSIDFVIYFSFIIFLSIFFEEFVFRRILFIDFLNEIKSNYSFIISLLLSSILFSLIHLSRTLIDFEDLSLLIGYLFFAFLYGVLLCIIYFYSNNFILIVILHIFANFQLEFLEPIKFDSINFSGFSFGITTILALYYLVSHRKKISVLRRRIYQTLLLILFILFYFVYFESKDIDAYHEHSLDENSLTTIYDNEGRIKYTLDKDSFMTIYDEDGRIKEYGLFRNGVKSGNWIEYNKDGKIIWQGNYQDKKEKK